MSNQDHRLSGLRVLVVEDEPLIVMMLEALLGDLGCEVLDGATDLASAMAACQRDDFDVALIDLDLMGESAMGVVELLVERGKPLAIASGSDHDLDRFPILRKPYDPDQLHKAMLALRLQLGSGGPRGDSLA